MRALFLLLPGCLLGSDPFKGDPNVPQIVAISRVAPQSDQEDELPFARAGQAVIVDLRTRAPIDPEATTVRLNGFPLHFEQSPEPLSWRYARTLEGVEGSAPQAISGVLRDAFGAETPFTSEVLLHADFIGPSAACVLSPTPANALQTVRLTITPSEPLSTAGPTVAASNPHLTVVPEGEHQGQHRFRIDVDPGVDVPHYTLDVGGSDRAGNPHEGTSLCDPSPPEGAVFTTPPNVDAQPALTVSPSVSDPSGLPRAGVGATITVTLSTTRPLDAASSLVSLGNIPLLPTTDALWTGQVDAGDGDGIKPLRLTLFDTAGNRQGNRMIANG